MRLCRPDPQSLDSYQNQTFTEDAKTTRAYLIAHSSVGLPIGGVKLVQKEILVYNIYLGYVEFDVIFKNITFIKAKSFLAFFQA